MAKNSSASAPSGIAVPNFRNANLVVSLDIRRVSAVFLAWETSSSVVRSPQRGENVAGPVPRITKPAEQCELANLVTLEDAPRVSRLRACGRKSAAAGVAKRHAAALTAEAGMQEMVGVVVHLVGVVIVGIPPGSGRG
ncbi:hypothetical protein AJ78_03399 [Emergomyces pasteurianus Ep9510]|uniref:Uncharacterized protein n=1 Tax=Emergomyces pasteurianus Ep9510 TaxID=1447872 RepID=A0A1J9QKK1_9EURO|nr:hypothetical protein AJ78_03399 [Emergomyces pasteurianus Ep9510]